MIRGKIGTMLCALLAATLVILASVLASQISEAGSSHAEAASDELRLGVQVSAKPSEGSGLPGEAALDSPPPDVEVLSAVTTPMSALSIGSESIGHSLHPLEARLLDLLNEERIQHGLDSLQVDDRLVALARERSSDMVVRNYFSHSTPEGDMVFKAMDEQGISYFLAGENLARNGFAESESAEVAHKGFMNSPAHRENELEAGFDRVGIGVALSEAGTVYFTELFISAR